MKVIIPVAGAGTKLRPFTYTQPKPLIPVAGKPILSYILDQLIASGQNDFIFVVGYLSDKIIEFLDEYYPHIQKKYIYQKERQGLGQAIFSCRDYIDDDEEVLIQLGDSILDIDFNVLTHCKHNTLAVRKVNDPRLFGVVELDDSGFIKNLVEKPQIPKSNLALVGLYYIKEYKQLVQALEYNIQNDLRTKGEFHLTDGLMRLLELGYRFEVMEVKNWFDCGKKNVLLETNAIMLDRMNLVNADFTSDNTIIIPPVNIGKNCSIKNSILGPHVSIGDNVEIDNSIIKEAIIGNYSLLDYIVMQNSIIGNDVVIKGKSQTYNIGDNTELDVV
ncbi:MAG: NTP transferase domain-containing protein [Saprospiraceae bacterium]|nr:NTP transferase domain-containing protein [Saprospiraceae bacterium]